MESYMGSIFITALAMFFIGLIFIAMKNFNSDVSILNSQTAQVKVLNLSTTERNLIDNWISDNQVKIPEGKGYRYIIQQYSSRPWLR